MKKLIEERNSNREKMSKGFVGLLVGILAFLMIFQVVISNRLVETADRLKSLDTEIDKIEKDNFVLAQDIREQGSLAKAEDQAIASGFVRSNNISFVKAITTTVAFGKVISLQ